MTVHLSPEPHAREAPCQTRPGPQTRTEASQVGRGPGGAATNRASGTPLPCAPQVARLTEHRLSTRSAPAWSGVRGSGRIPLTVVPPPEPAGSRGRFAAAAPLYENGAEGRVRKDLGSRGDTTPVPPSPWSLVPPRSPRCEHEIDLLVVTRSSSRSRCSTTRWAGRPTTLLRLQHRVQYGGRVVKRRRAPIRSGVDERLLRFVASEWPGSEVREAFEAWRQARLEFVEANPDGALGGLLDVLRGNAAERQRIERLLGGPGAVS